VIEHGGDIELSYAIDTGDRAVLATLSGALAKRSHEKRMSMITSAADGPEK
jgi:hypothetical protein